MKYSWNRWHIHVGFWTSVLVAFLFGRITAEPEILGEIRPDILSDVRKMFADYTSGNALYYVKAELLEGIVLDVATVASYSGGDHGFITTDRPRGTQFYVEGEGFRIQRFNEGTFFFDF
jgi:hypothetical protein